MIKFSEIKKAVSSLDKLRTSTGDAFDLESGAAALIRLSYLKAEIEKAEKAIKENLPEGFTFENAMGKITIAKTATYSQDVPAIIAAMSSKGIDWQGLVKFRKTGIGKTEKAIIESNESLESESVSFKVIKKDQEKPDFDFTLE